ncbi:MAG TPA: site-2 protease family protein [Nitrososphaerales archaeon]
MSVEEKPVDESEENKEKKEDKAISIQFPLILLRTKRGLDILNKLASLKPIKNLGTASLILFPIIGAIGFVLISYSATITIQSTTIRAFVKSAGPLVNLMIPGLNPYVPIIYGWLALVVAMVVHEGSHGIMARFFNYRVKSSGIILFLILPIGAFVDIDEEEVKKAPARNSARVMAAGPISNLTVAIVSLICLMLVVGSMNPVAEGVGVTGVYEKFPADSAGLKPADMIIAINNQNVRSGSDIRSIITTLKPGDTVSLRTLHEGKEVDRTVILVASENSSTPIMGFEAMDSGMISNVLKNYQEIRVVSPLLYLFLPTFTMGQWQVPYSDMMHQFYTSPLGSYTYAVANSLFWLWFVNFNLAVFNALPLYPLDGGQAVRAALESYGSSKGWKEKTAKRIVTVISLMVLALILVTIVMPYLLG